MENNAAVSGDGANDVSMIQVADVGIGISGQEGMQVLTKKKMTIILVITKNTVKPKSLQNTMKLLFVSIGLIQPPIQDYDRELFESCSFLWWY